MSPNSFVDVFLREAIPLCDAQNIDAFADISEKILREVQDRPELLDERFLTRYDNNIAVLSAQVIDAHFNEAGVAMLHKAIECADKMVPLIPDEKARECFKWRWGMAFDMTNLYIRNAVHMELNRPKIDMTKVRMDMQVWMKPDENGTLVTLNEHIQFYDA